jgi:DNA-binding transcriptional MerR regulator
MMPIKMKNLMELTGESKSTILYYLKEGLLPEPQKPKPNLHLYDESSVNIIKFIKYLQQQFSYSIAQIKMVFSENNFDFSDNFSMMLKSLQMMSGSSDGVWYSEEDFLELSGLSFAELSNYLHEGLLFPQERGFSNQELKIVKILQDAKELGLDKALFEEYVVQAKALASIEYQLGAKMLEQEPRRNNEQYELLFDAILTLKPYLFNMNTIQEHKQQMEKKNECAKQS